MNDQRNEPGRERRGRLLYVLLFALLFTGFVPVLFVAQKLNRLYEEELRSTLGEKQFTLAAAIAETLDTHVDGARARVAELAAALGTVAEHSGSGEQRRLIRGGDFLDGFVGGDLILVRFVDRRDRTYEAASQPRIPDAWVDRLVTGGRGDGAELITQPVFVPEVGIPVLAISRPVLAGGRLSGVVTGVFNLASIWDELVDSLNVPYTAYVLNQDGHLVAHTDPSRLGQPMPRHYLVERFLGPTSRDRETTSFVVTGGSSGDVRVLGTKMATRNGWGVFVQVEEALAFAPAVAVRAEARKWAGLTLALGIGVAVLFAGYLTRPIHRLAAAARAFAAGNLETRVEVSARNELGVLGDTFNSMASEIRDQLDKLREAAVENRELFLGTIRALAVAIDEKDPYTRGHSERVNRLSLIIGRHLGLDEAEMEDLNIGSLLHDLGKIGVDDRILRKPAALTDEEFELMKQHPGRGANILAGVKALERIVPAMK
ncbi:MAG: HAMP domain-containing protein, partial [Acidobacteriota bacterium]